ncbi:MAG: type II toxin-antitoxin system HicB family antitoxin [Planctomycetota bacterium]
MTRTYTAYIEYDSDTESYVGTVPGLPGAHSQGKSLDELQRNLREVVQLVLEERKARGEPIDVDPFVGLQQVIVRV